MSEGVCAWPSPKHLPASTQRLWGVHHMQCTANQAANNLVAPAGSVLPAQQPTK
jgi:hypothetical protein